MTSAGDPACFPPCAALRPRGQGRHALVVVSAAGSVMLIALHLNGAAVGVACAAFLAEALIPLFARET
jgi:hypothetical protein